MQKSCESLERLKEFEEKYCTSKMVNSQMMYWYYKIKGHNKLKDSVPEIDDWVYHYEQFLDIGGDLNELKEPDAFLGRYF